MLRYYTIGAASRVTAGLSLKRRAYGHHTPLELGPHCVVRRSCRASRRRLPRSVYVLHKLHAAHASALSLLQFLASAGFGKPAYTSTSHEWAGVAMHFLVSIGWGIGYAYMAFTKPAIKKNPLISGFIFGLVVYVVMQFALYTVRALGTPDAIELYLTVLAYTVFFGVPVALVARLK